MIKQNFSFLILAQLALIQSSLGVLAPTPPKPVPPTTLEDLIPEVRCVNHLGNGRLEAYFNARNSVSYPLISPIGKDKNKIQSPPSRFFSIKKQNALFAPGMNYDAAIAQGQNLVYWNLGAPNGSRRAAYAMESDKRCCESKMFKIILNQSALVDKPKPYSLRTLMTINGMSQQVLSKGQHFLGDYNRQIFSRFNANAQVAVGTTNAQEAIDALRAGEIDLLVLGANDLSTAVVPDYITKIPYHMVYVGNSKLVGKITIETDVYFLVDPLMLANKFFDVLKCKGMAQSVDELKSIAIEMAISKFLIFAFPTNNPE